MSMGSARVSFAVPGEEQASKEAGDGPAMHDAAFQRMFSGACWQRPADQFSAGLCDGAGIYGTCLECCCSCQLQSCFELVQRMLCSLPCKQSFNESDSQALLTFQPAGKYRHTYVTYPGKATGKAVAASEVPAIADAFPERSGDVDAAQCPSEASYAPSAQD